MSRQISSPQPEFREEVSPDRCSQATLAILRLVRMCKRSRVRVLRMFSFFRANVEAWQPDPGARPRLENRDLNQGSQSTRNGIGLVHRRFVRSGGFTGLQPNVLPHKLISNESHEDSNWERKKGEPWRVGKSERKSTNQVIKSLVCKAEW